MRRTLLASSLASLAVLTLQAPAVRAEAPTDTVAFDLTDVGLPDFLSLVSTSADPPLRFLYGPHVAAVRVSLVNRNPIPRSRVESLVRSILAYHNLVLIRVDLGDETVRTFHIVRAEAAQSEPVPIVSIDQLAARDPYEFVSCVIPVQYDNAREIQGMLKLMRQDPVGNIAALSESNTLLVKDFAIKVQEIAAAVTLMDTPRSEEPAGARIVTLDLDVYVLPGAWTNPGGSVITGAAAEELALALAARDREALVRGRSGWVFDLDSIHASLEQTSVVEKGETRLAISAELVAMSETVETTTTTGVVQENRIFDSLGAPRLDIEVEAGSAEAGVARFASDFTLPVASGGRYGFVRSFGMGQEGGTLVLLATVRRSDGR